MYMSRYTCINTCLGIHKQVHTCHIYQYMCTHMRARDTLESGNLLFVFVSAELIAAVNSVGSMLR